MSAPRPVRALVALGVLVCIVWALLGCKGLTIPIGSPDELARWADDTPPAVMAAALVRLAALAAAIYCAGVVAVVLVADIAQCGAVAQAALSTAPAVLRRALGGGAAQVVLVAGAMVANAPVVSAQESAQATATMTRVEPGPLSVATMTWVGQVDPPPSEAFGPPAPAAADPTTAMWVVEPGDSFWSIAEQTIAEHGSNVDVTAYWEQLITANRDRLVSPACPDLLIPGQTLSLPTP